MCEGDAGCSESTAAGRISPRLLSLLHQAIGIYAGVIHTGPSRPWKQQHSFTTYAGDRLGSAVGPIQFAVEYSADSCDQIQAYSMAIIMPP